MKMMLLPGDGIDDECATQKNRQPELHRHREG